MENFSSRALDLVDLLESSLKFLSVRLTHAKLRDVICHQAGPGTIGCKMLGLVEPP